ncbi:MAG: hypothetical protein ACKVRP_11455 [Bacteroidota bacterium]
MKTAAWTAILALIVTIPLLIAKRKRDRVLIGSRTVPDENRLYDIEDFVD